MLMDIWHRLVSIVRRRRREAEMDVELRFHLEMQAEENMRRGMGLAQAGLAARRALGGVDQVKEACRDSWGTRTIDVAWRDLAFGLRSLRRAPGFAATVILTIGLGVGVNIAVFTMVRGVLLRPLPYGAGDRLVELRQFMPGAASQNLGFGVKEVADYRTASRMLDDVAEYHSMYFNWFARGEPQRVQTGVVSANFFPMFGVRPVLGRLFEASDDVPGAPPVLVLTYEFWQRSFAGDRGVIGSSVEMNDRVHVIVGILPPLPPWPDANQVFMPAAACPFRSAPRMLERRDMRMVQAFGRLRPGVSVQQAGAELASLALRFAKSYPEARAESAGLSAGAVAAMTLMAGQARTPFLVLLGASGLVLLLVCANMATLMLARLHAREREFAVRAALGAGRGRIIAQLMSESILLSLGGGAVGLLLATMVEGLLVSFAGRFSVRAGDIAVDAPVLLFAFAVSVAAGLVVALIAGLTRREAVVRGLKDGGRVAGDDGMRVRRVLVVSQVAISFALLIGAGLLTRSLVRLQQVDPGFKLEHVLSVGIDLDWTRYNDADRRRAFYRELLVRARRVPGVKGASMSLTVPLNESQPYEQGLTVEGQPTSGRTRPVVDFRTASADYFATIGIPLVAGRVFSDGDDETAMPVAVVSESLARHVFAGRDPVGRRVSLDKGEHWTTVVGVVGDVRQYGLDKAPADGLYLPVFQRPGLGGTLLMRSNGDPSALAAVARGLVRALDVRQPVVRIRTLEDLRGASLASRRLTALLISLIALLALLVTSAGVAGVVAFTVSHRTHEIGVRMALGADRLNLVRMVISQAMIPVAAGLALGSLGSLGLSTVVGSLLFETRPTDPATFATAFVGLTLVAACACLVPARRASAISPLEALREG